MNRKSLEKAGNEAVRLLRKNKLSQGHPFMINTDLLPLGQCYMEYPDGIIKIVTIDRNINDFKIIAELSLEESNSLRKKFKIE